MLSVATAGACQRRPIVVVGAALEKKGNKMVDFVTRFVNVGLPYTTPIATSSSNKKKQDPKGQKKMRITRIERVTYRWTVRSSVWRSPN